MAEGPSGSAGAAGASAPTDPAAAGGGPATGAATGAAAVDEAFAAKTRDAVLLSNPLLAQVVSFNVRDRWVSVRALEEYLKVESYAVRRAARGRILARARRRRASRERASERSAAIVGLEHSIRPSIQPVLGFASGTVVVYQYRAVICRESC